MFNADQRLVENFAIPKSRGAGDFSIQYQCFAWNKETLAAEAYLDFNDQIWTTTIHDRLAELGARTITVMTFQNNDNNHSAASALNRVIAVSKTDGFKSVVRGECNPRLAEKAREMMEAEKKPESAEFDEKTKAVLLMSLENMATKEGLSHLEEKSDGIQSSVDDMKEIINNDYQGLIATQKVTIDHLYECITNKDRNTMQLESQIKRQTHMIAKLNFEKDKLNSEKAKLNEEKDHANKVIAELNAEKARTAIELKEKDHTILTLASQKNNVQIPADVAMDLLDVCNVLLAEVRGGKKRKHDDGDDKE